MCTCVHVRIVQCLRVCSCVCVRVDIVGTRMYIFVCDVCALPSMYFVSALIYVVCVFVCVLACRLYVLYLSIINRFDSAIQ